MERKNNVDRAGHDAAGSSRGAKGHGRHSSDLKRLKYVNLLRCSNLTQADTSPDDQKHINDAFGAASGMRWVDDVWAEGVSGSQTFNRADIEQVLDLHRRTPFDVLVVHDLSRLTRGGIRHGNVVEDTFRKAGIRVVSSTDDIPDGPEGDLIKSVKHYANQMQARSISLSVARGLSQSLAKNTRPAAGRCPYALDRLYVGPDGKGRMLVRWDGPVQRWLNSETLAQVGQRVREPRPPRPKTHPDRRPAQTGIGRKRRQPFKGYVRQADETSRLVPGAPERVATLAWMFEAYDVGRWGYHRIANDLNRRGVPGPEGGPWILTSVKDVLFNPIYLGVEVRHRWTKALYNKIDPDGPAPVHVDQDQLERDGRRSVPMAERPRDEWRLVDVPHLKDLLPEPVRSLAARRIMHHLDPDRPPHPRKGKPLRSGEAKHKHLDSPFLLTNVLHSKQTGHSMRGDTVNKKLKDGRKVYRYYFDGGAQSRGERGLHVRRVPAEPVERAVLGAVEAVLADAGGVAERVRTAVAEAASRLDGPGDETQAEREQLEVERQQITARLKQAYKVFGADGIDAVADEVRADRERLAEVGRMLVGLGRAGRASSEPVAVDRIVDAVVRRLGDLRGRWGALPNAEVKQLLAAMVEGLEIDLATGELSFGIVLPAAMRAGSDRTNDVGPEACKVRLGCEPPWALVVETNWDMQYLQPVTISRWGCHPEKSGCYACSRRRAA